MKKILLILLVVLCASGQSQNFKTVIATYLKSGQWGEWSGLVFTKEDKSEMRFLKTTNQEVVLKPFWKEEVVGTDPEDVSGELHTNKWSVGQKYFITYTTKKVEYKGMSEDGAEAVYENVIVTFEPAGGGNINGASCKIYRDGELKAVGFGDRVYQISTKGEKEFEKIIQNKNETCRGTTCVKTIVEKDGVIYTLVLPNVTDKSLRGKVVGNEILKWETNYQGEGQYKSRGITYVGDRNIAVLTTLVYAWF